jgi:hypothetical protein
VVTTFCKRDKSGADKGPTVDLQDETQKKDKSGIGRFVDPTGDGTLEQRPTPMHASLVDFFVGEHENDKHLIEARASQRRSRRSTTELQ